MPDDIALLASLILDNLANEKVLDTSVDLTRSMNKFHLRGMPVLSKSRIGLFIDCTSNYWSQQFDAPSIRR